MDNSLRDLFVHLLLADEKQKFMAFPVHLMGVDENVLHDKGFPKYKRVLHETTIRRERRVVVPVLQPWSNMRSHT